MTIEPGTGSPQPRAGKAQRKRGQSVLSGLPSTDAFSNHRILSVPDRMLILFLVVALADEHGCLTTLHERIAAAAAGDREHWAHGRPADKMPNSTTKWLGRSAVRRPPWKRIEEFLRLQLAPDHLPLVLATAAGLYCQAAGISRPCADYEGQIYLPDWAKHTKATTGSVQSSLRDLLAALDEGVVDGEQPPTTGVNLDMLSLIKDRDKYKVLLSEVSRAFRHVERYAERQHDEAEYGAWSMQQQGDQFVEHNQLQLDHKKLKREHEQLRTHYAELLMRVVKGISRETAERMIDDQLAPAKAMPARTQWEIITTTAPPGPRQASF